MKYVNYLIWFAGCCSAVFIHRFPDHYYLFELIISISFGWLGSILRRYHRLGHS